MASLCVEDNELGSDGIGMNHALSANLRTAAEDLRRRTEKHEACHKEDPSTAFHSHSTSYSSPIYTRVSPLQQTSDAFPGQTSFEMHKKYIFVLQPYRQSLVNNVLISPL